MDRPLDDGHSGVGAAGSDEIRYVDLRPEDRTSFDIRPLLSHPDPAAPSESPHRHNFQELMWFKSGSGRHAIDNQILEIRPHTFYLIAKGQVHQFLEGHDIEGYLIRFTDDFLPDVSSAQTWNCQIALFSNIAINHTLPIGEENVPALELLLQQIVQEYDCQEGFGKYEVLRHLLSILLVRLERTRRTLPREKRKAIDYRDDIFQNFGTLLEEHYKTFHRVDQYAAALNITPRQLSEVLKLFLGKTAKQVIKERLVLEAKRYLKYTNLSVKEIAYALGYKDPSYFSKVFKRFTGVAPQAYR
jgi:AraC family transcriptional activator of pobA